ncbi:hypothetical protein LEP1GSC193_4092 [Leptospira alstonii serovar Pingchang str. 80-412]|uniref:Uncharacterized protein n=2 Tax=Leptospira alstonii TaxID=28452 RepID=M6CIP3_9LEPT|nr:hypothetical protein LEP1GSC194_1138 [Leptospira alstonii serovar Sichuan str. 79601]EQA80478.1 hypothetical protein LEP1GSC193_4092 [Leptospira alstonii serovar Pingchang str. 80-412]
MNLKLKPSEKRITFYSFRKYIFLFLRIQNFLYGIKMRFVFSAKK